MRQTGRTTRMLLSMALYISEHADEEKHIGFYAFSMPYARDCMKQLCRMLPCIKQVSSDCFIFKNVKITILLHEKHTLEGCRYDQFFEDHYNDIRGIE